MAMKKSYYTVDGQIIGYKTAAGRKDFLTDSLGSITAEVDQTGATKTYDGRYKPYGGELSSTGARGSYGWVGSWGYRETGQSASSHYVRARHYSKTSGIWTTNDPLWPNERSYLYVKSNPLSYSDPQGLDPDRGCGTHGKGDQWNCIFIGPPGSESDPAYWHCYPVSHKPKVEPIEQKYDKNGRPALPPGESYVHNCCLAMKFGNIDNVLTQKGMNDVSFYAWYYQIIRKNSNWDFKRGGKREYEDAGNYHYGFTTCCAGISLQQAAIFAGFAQHQAGTSRNEWDKPPYYGDDPKDYEWIRKGYQDCMKNRVELKRKCQGSAFISPFPAKL